ncbi:MAG: hypothetical protein JWN98_1047 [Abditibacteriota bacterium]|nr:hypothetical protein [Abditibacteriota bacterium]
MNMTRRNLSTRYKRHGHICRRRKGQALVEFALLFPFLIVLTVGIMQYSRLFNASHLTTSILREGARYAAKHGTESQTNYGGIMMTSDNAIRAYIRDVADDTRVINRADLPDANITITPALGSAQRASGNAITVTLRYDMRKQIFVPTSLPGLSRIGISTSSVSMIIE